MSQEVTAMMQTAARMAALETQVDHLYRRLSAIEFDVGAKATMNAARAACAPVKVVKWALVPDERVTTYPYVIAMFDSEWTAKNAASNHIERMMQKFRVARVEWEE